VRRDLLALLAVSLAGSLAVPATALGIDVHVRVESVRTTVFGATQPLVEPSAKDVTLPDGPLALPASSALAALEAASVRGEFFYRLVMTGFGPYISQVGRVAESATSGWVYKVNGVSPPVGAYDYILEDGDEVLFYYATFGPTGGPLTLDLERAGRGCFQAFEVDDAGTRAPADDVVFRVGSRAVGDADGRICPRGHWHRIKVTKPGAIRSEVIAR
jgi:hypothetical protein